MSIASLQFAGFVAIALAGHHLMPAHWRKYLLLVASYGFYWLVAERFVAVLLLVSTVNFALAPRLRSEPHARTWLWIGVGFNLATLAILRQLHPSNPFAGPFIVAGLSFYALQAVSYLLDLRSGKLAAPSRFTDLALYLAYFPKLVAGPIEPAHAFLPQLERPRAVDETTVARALTLIAVGITRKLVIADPLAALLPEKVFSEPLQFSAVVVVGTLVAYAFVLYNDFAGYTGIVRGVSKLFGIELSPNFAQPFFAQSFADFWNRWHISLSRWLRDYLYLPLSRALLRRNPSPGTAPNVLLPPMTAMLASGLWHAPALHMLVWGGWHGLFLAGERVRSLARPLAGRARAPGQWRRVARALVVFLLGTAALSFFRMNIGTAAQFWERLCSGTGSGALPRSSALLVAVSLCLDWIAARHGEETVFHPWPRTVRAALLAFAALLWFLMTRGEAPTPFVYQGF